MRFRAGVVTGLAAGFYLGAMAGRERYHQMNRVLRRVKRSDAIDTVIGRAKTVVTGGLGRAMDATGNRVGRANPPDPTEMSGARLAPASPRI